MKNFSWNQFNETWRNARLTVVSILFPVFGILFLLYRYCEPFHNWVDRKLNKMFKN